MGFVGAQVHERRDGASALPLGIIFKEFAHLKEQHHEHGLGHFGLAAGQKTDEQGTERGHTHEQIFIKGFALNNALPRFGECFVTSEQIGRQIDE